MQPNRVREISGNQRIWKVVSVRLLTGHSLISPGDGKRLKRFTPLGSSPAVPTKNFGDGKGPPRERDETPARRGDGAARPTGDGGPGAGAGGVGLRQESRAFALPLPARRRHAPLGYCRVKVGHVNVEHLPMKVVVPSLTFLEPMAGCPARQ
jgi:hypothetical protein